MYNIRKITEFKMWTQYGCDVNLPQFKEWIASQQAQYYQAYADKQQRPHRVTLLSLHRLSHRRRFHLMLSYVALYLFNSVWYIYIRLAVDIQEDVELSILNVRLHLTVQQLFFMLLKEHAKITPRLERRSRAPRVWAAKSNTHNPRTSY
ncbi:hypothetical protein K503DRAFT_787075 [Rhizopogon vinicolor AM-OR11-026]|uniref:Uncharacterized protein n=1 Tax=Rhizopogon vinicolor AM-OR11-026 TaxID=1314800 RepID=A0A1B7MJ51_9AGAM|nr:hypothetical protein K503DRAFT_787075 [Rhizopogon vinicolor AM-OR11-026]